MDNSIDITTPAFLFSTISLLMGAYTARFSAISKLIRKLHHEVKNGQQSFGTLETQIGILNRRLRYVKYLQFFAVLSLFFSTFAMLAILVDLMFLGIFNFVLSLIFFMISLIFSILEIQSSVRAINWQIEI